MKKRISASFIKICAGYHVLFIFIQLYLYSLHIQSQYQLQKQEKKYTQLVHAQEQETQKLYALQDLKNVKKYAKKVLSMKKIRLSDIKEAVAT